MVHIDYQLYFSFKPIMKFTILFKLVLEINIILFVSNGRLTKIYLIKESILLILNFNIIFHKENVFFIQNSKMENI